MTFTNQELAAILRLAHAMAMADGKVTNDETHMIVNEMRRFGVSLNNAKLIEEIGVKMSHGECCQVVSNMTTEEKKYVTAFLGTLICIDGDIDDTEMKLWSLISAMCDLPTMNIFEAVKIMANL
ncbi:MAG: tellurite resistance protein TerB [Alphaproteobacteria bacterium]|nr:tellurite resistance protein TerB [Alphaproteobacteria bacterium]